jgi:hypothetical protein
LLTRARRTVTADLEKEWGHGMVVNFLGLE